MKNKFLLALCILGVATIASAKQFTIDVDDSNLLIPNAHLLSFTGSGITLTDKTCFQSGGSGACLFTLQASDSVDSSATIILGNNKSNCTIVVNNDIWGGVGISSVCFPYPLQISKSKSVGEGYHWMYIFNK